MRILLYHGPKDYECRYIHRIIAETFLPNPENLPQVNHKDENKQNNRADNLEWCTAHYNWHYSGVEAKFRAAQHKAESVPVIVFRYGKLLGKFESMRVAANSIGKLEGQVREWARGIRKNRQGYEIRLL